MNCLGCLQSVSERELLVCTHCHGTYHHICVDISITQYFEWLELKKQWTCPACNNVTNRRMGADNTPVRSSSSLQQNSTNISFGDSIREPDAQANMSCDESLLDENSILNETNRKAAGPLEKTAGHLITYDSFGELLDSKLSVLKRDINKHFENLVHNLKSEFNNSFEALVSTVNTLKNDMASATERINCLERENLTLKTELADTKTHHESSCDTRSLHETLNSLKIELNDKEQATLQTDIEVAGVPEFKHESCVSILLSIAMKLGVNLDERDVVSARRVGRWSEAATRPRPLVARLARRALRDQLIKASRVRRGASTADMGLPNHEPCSFYVNERLTKTNRMLLGKAKELRQTNKWKYSWSDAGCIFVRENDKSTVYQIRAECDLNRIFNTSPIPEKS